ncbi:WD40-repeat-containing domain protein [Chytriomyces sp. MP71]|nr:WD40-repeat-containing domain protein [Chytriomyces sp. MP71]
MNLAGKRSQPQMRKSNVPQQSERWFQDVPSLPVFDSSLGGTNIIIAKRRIVKVNLNHSLAIDAAITALDVHNVTGVAVMACDKVLYLWDLKTLEMKQRYGRVNGSIHREKILAVKFDYPGLHLVSCGLDHRVVVWNVKTTKSDKILEGHRGAVFDASFTRDGERVVSCADDGRVVVWEWRTGAVLLSYLRHPAAVRGITFFPEHPEKIVCGRNDGNITIWDLNVKGIVDNIAPDPDWIQDGEEQSLVAWFGIHKHHSGKAQKRCVDSEPTICIPSGAIMAVAVSPNGKFLASAATDHTTKLWNVVSYNKDVEIVQAELMEAAQKSRQMDTYIDVFNDKYDIQIQMKEFTGLKIGEVPIPTGYHADLLFTYRHEAAVVSIVFNNDSDIVITGSLDATCRLWSCRRGDLIFQINLPSAVSSVRVSNISNHLYVACQNRMLEFEIFPSAKEEDLPESWRLNAEAFYSGDNTRVKNSPATKERDEDIDPAVLAQQKQVMTVADLKQLISHGLVLPTFLDTLLEQCKSVDPEKLFFNMKKFKMGPNQLFRLLANSKFHPRDILTALSQSKNAGVLYSAALSGTPITSLMMKLGYTPYDPEKEDIYLHFIDFSPELNMLETAAAQGLAAAGSSRGKSVVYFGTPLGEVSGAGGRRESDEYYRQLMHEQQFYSNNEGERYFGELQGPKWERPKNPEGDVVKYIPSEQIKLLKDLHSHREIKPIFMKQVLVDSPKHPNFTPDSPIRDTTPWVPKRATVSKPGVRFNETVTNTRGQTAQSSFLMEASN